VRADRELRYLTYIRDTIRTIEQHTASGPEAFLEDEVLQAAVIRWLETLADATRHLSTELKERQPGIPWTEVTNFRNRVAHGYLDIDLNLVWRVVEEDLPPLKVVVEQELHGNGPDLE